VDQDPVAGADVLALEEPDVDGAPDSADVDIGQIGTIGVELDDLPGDPQTHGVSQPFLG
jgi:hypothetical protein